MAYPATGKTSQRIGSSHPGLGAAVFARWARELPEHFPNYGCGIPIAWLEKGFGAGDRGELMYRILLRTNERLVVNNEWVDAVTVREARSGAMWEFLDGNGFVVRRLPKAWVQSYEIAEDRRKDLPLEYHPKPDPSRLEPVDSPRPVPDLQKQRLSPESSNVPGRHPAQEPGQPPAR
jgi:hypothetical protein